MTAAIPFAEAHERFVSLVEQVVRDGVPVEIEHPSGNVVVVRFEDWQGINGQTTSRAAEGLAEMTEWFAENGPPTEEERANAKRVLDEAGVPPM
jgi:hypothetical protein